jgi:hypothetical protein
VRSSRRGSRLFAGAAVVDDVLESRRKSVKYTLDTNIFIDGFS